MYCPIESIISPPEIEITHIVYSKQYVKHNGLFRFKELNFFLLRLVPRSTSIFGALSLWGVKKKKKKFGYSLCYKKKIRKKKLSMFFAVSPRFVSFWDFLLSVLWQVKKRKRFFSTAENKFKCCIPLVSISGPSCRRTTPVLLCTGRSSFPGAEASGWRLRTGTQGSHPPLPAAAPPSVAGWKLAGSAGDISPLTRPQTSLQRKEKQLTCFCCCFFFHLPTQWFGELHFLFRTKIPAASSCYHAPWHEKKTFPQER